MALPAANCTGCRCRPPAPFDATLDACVCEARIAARLSARKRPKAACSHLDQLSTPPPPHQSAPIKPYRCSFFLKPSSCSVRPTPAVISRLGRFELSLDAPDFAFSTACRGHGCLTPSVSQGLRILVSIDIGVSCLLPSPSVQTSVRHSAVSESSKCPGSCGCPGHCGSKPTFCIPVGGSNGSCTQMN